MLNAAASFQSTCCDPRLGSLLPNDFANPLAAFIKAVRAFTSSARARITLRWICALRAPMAHRPQQLRIDSGQPCQRPSIMSIIFSTALGDQLYFLRMGHEHFVSQFR